MSVTKIEHPSIDERRAKGKKTRERTAASAPRGLEAGRGSPRPGRAARGAERDP